MMKELGLAAIVAGMLTACEGKSEPPHTPSEVPPAISEPEVPTKTAEEIPVKPAEASEPLEEKVESIRLEYVGEHNGNFIGSFGDTYVFYDRKRLEFCDGAFTQKKVIELDLGRFPIVSPTGKFVASRTDSGKKAQLLVYDIGGEKAQCLVKKDIPYLGGVTFSHDGKFLAYTKYPPVSESEHPARTTIVLMETNLWTDAERYDTIPLYRSTAYIEFSWDDRFIATKGESDTPTIIIDRSNKDHPTETGILFGGRITFDRRGYIRGGIKERLPSPAVETQSELVDKVNIYDTKTGKKVKELLQEGEVIGVAATDEGWTIVATLHQRVIVDEEKERRIREEYQERKKQGPLSREERSQWATKFERGHRTSETRHKLRLYDPMFDIKWQQDARTCMGDKCWIDSITLSHDGRYLITNDTTSEIRTGEFRTRSHIYSIKKD